jgi:hypothetical protein
LVVAVYVSIPRRKPAPPGKPVKFGFTQFMDDRGHPYFVVTAASDRDALRVVNGWTYPGNMHWVCRTIGTNKYIVRLEE